MEREKFIHWLNVLREALHTERITGYEYAMARWEVERWYSHALMVKDLTYEHRARQLPLFMEAA